jgi:hypothetical protein
VRIRTGSSSLTLTELHRRVGGSRETLVTILNDERRKGTIDYCSTMRRYSVNGGMSDDLHAALLEL